VVEGFQNDRVMLVAAEVTFNALLALFPAIAAVVSLYGLFTDATTITNRLGLLAGFLPAGAVEVIGDQIKLLTAQGQGTLGFTFISTLALSLWGANAAHRSHLRCPQHHLQRNVRREAFPADTALSRFHARGPAAGAIAIGSIVIVPVALKVIGFSDGSTASLLSLLRWPLLFAALLFALACLYRFGPSREHPQWRWVTWAAPSPPASGSSALCCCPGCGQLRQL